MSAPSENTDPRDIDSEGAWTEIDPSHVSIDPSKAVLLEAMRSSLIQVKDNQGGDQLGMAFQLRGRVNGTDEEVAVLFLSDLAGVASLVAQFVELSANTPEEIALGFAQYMEAELQRLVDERTADEDPQELEERRNDVQANPS